MTQLPPLHPQDTPARARQRLQLDPAPLKTYDDRAYWQRIADRLCPGYVVRPTVQILPRAAGPDDPTIDGPEEPPECPPQYAVGGGKVGPRPERRAA